MKKELKKGNAKLSLGKMTVAKLSLSSEQMLRIVGGSNGLQTLQTSGSSVDTAASCTAQTSLQTFSQV